MPSADPPNNELTLTYKSSYVTLICLLIYAHPVPNPRMISMSRYLTTILSIWAPCVDRGPIAIKCSPTCPAYPIRRFGGRAASDRVSGQMRLVARQNLTLLTSEASWTILSSCLQHFADHASRFFVAGVQYSSDVVGFSCWSQVLLGFCRRWQIVFSWSALLLIGSSASTCASVLETLETGDGGVAACRPVTWAVDTS